ncbi:MAG: hypothetical protein ACTSU5_03505 [Promethearchaeota archaeon]
MVSIGWDDVKDFWLWFPRSAGWMVIMLGFLAITWFGYSWKRRGGVFHASKESWAEDIDPTKVLRGLSYIGLFLGLLIVVAAVVGLIRDIPPSAAYAEKQLNCDFYSETCVGNNNFTSILLIVLGLVCFMRPIADVPWASILGLLAGSAAAIALAFFVPIPDHVTTWKYWKYALIVIFLVVSVVVGLAFKFWTNGLAAFSKFLSWPPIAAAIVILCFVQGVLLIQYGTSLDLFWK